MQNLVSARLASLLLSSAYMDDGRGKLVLVDPPPADGRNPLFWPDVGEELWCKRSLFNPVSSLDPPVQPFPPMSIGVEVGIDDLSGGRWTNIVEEGEDGRKILVGRIPSYVEFFNGRPPIAFKKEISIAEADAFLSSLTTVASQRLSTARFFSAVPEPSVMLLPPKSFGPFPPVDPGPRGPIDTTGGMDLDPRGPLENLGPRDKALPHNCWERLCCIGLDIEQKVLTAVVEIVQTTGYGGTLCATDSFESVGFWLIEPSRVELQQNDWVDKPLGNKHSVRPPGPCAGGSVRFIGSTSFPISDIPRHATPIRTVCEDPALRYSEGPLHYSVSIPLGDDDLELMKKCEADSARLPVLHAVLGFNIDIDNDNYGGHGVIFGDWQSKVVQFPVVPPPQVRRITAVGIRNSPCPDILFSSIIRHGIDTMVIQVSGELKRALDEAGEMTILSISEELLPRLNRDTMILSEFIVSRTTITTEDEIINGIADLAEPPIGNWIICAVIGQADEDVAWTTSRDLVLTGIGPSYATSCVGTVDTFQVKEIEMAGPDIVSLETPGFQQEDNDASYNYGDCVDKSPKVSWKPKTTRNIMLFYPVQKGSDHNLGNHYKATADCPLVLLNYANGAIYEEGRQGITWQNYTSVIEQFVLQGAVVAIVYPKDPLSSFFLRDIFSQLIARIEEVLPQQRACPIFLFGHSAGGFQVARVLEENTLPQTLRNRIRGAVILAGAFYGGVDVKNIPVLLIQGGIDPQVPFVKIKCDGGGYSKFVVSSVTAYENSDSQMSVLLVVDTGTHFRWIDNNKDDIAETRVWNENKLDNITLLDGPNEIYDGSFSSHQAILMSYMTYFFRAVTFDDSNLTQFFVNKTIMPPDIVNLEESEEVIKQLHLYSKGRQLPSINRLSVANKGTSQVYGYNGIRVRRTVTGNGRQLNRPDELLLGSTLDEPDPPPETPAIPLMNRELVFAIDSSVKYSFQFSSGIDVVDSDVLVASFAVLNPDGSLFKDAVSLSLTIVLVDGLEIELDHDLLALLKVSRDIILPYIEDSATEKKEVSGELSTVEELKLPITWMFQTCLKSDVPLTNIAIKEIAFVCHSRSDNPVIFGLGTVEIMSMNEWEFAS